MAYETNVSDQLIQLGACLCATITAEGLPEPCFCGVVPGDAASHQYSGNCPGGKCGMAWVRLVSAYPMRTIGQANVEPSNCNKALGYDIELGIMRCITIGDSRGNPPTAKQMEDAVKLQIADMKAMRKAILCCDAIDHKDIILGIYNPIGPEGGLVGGTWSASLAI